MTEQTWWEQQGYLAGRELDAGLWLCVARMMFTYRLMVCAPDWVCDFYCYEQPADALAAFAEWDGRGEAPGPWVKSHTHDGGEIHRSGTALY